MTHTNRGYILALISAVILSTTSILIRYLTETFHLPALVLAFWRDGITALSLLLALVLLNRKLLRVERKNVLYLLIYSFVLAFFNSLWTLSVAWNGAAVSTVLAYCSAGFTALLGWWFLKEQLNWVKIVAVVLSLGGCVLVADALDPQVWRMNPIGIIAGTMSGLMYAVYTLMGRSANQRGLNPWTTILYTFGGAAVFLLAGNYLGRGFLPGAISQPGDLLWLGSDLTGWLVLVALAAGPTLIGFGLYNMSLADLPSSVVNLIVTSEPVFTAVIAYLLLKERFSEIQLFGGFLILAGVVFLRIMEGRTRKSAAPAGKIREGSAP